MGDHKLPAASGYPRTGELGISALSQAVALSAPTAAGTDRVSNEH